MKFILLLFDTDGRKQVSKLEGDRSIAEICAEAQARAVAWGADAYAELLCVEQSIDLLGAVKAAREAARRAEDKARAERLRAEANEIEKRL